MSDPQVRVGIAAFVFRDGKFLMQQRKGSHGEGTWSTPGGHLEFGESFEDTARREVKEETGMDITNVRFGAITNDQFVDEGKHYVTIWMISDWAKGEPYITEPDKCIAQDWFDFDTLPEPLFLPWVQLKKSEYIDMIRTQLLHSK
ncbi:MAG: NUDIX hydrolase [Candidatus Microsaccharimonas sp.]